MDCVPTCCASQLLLTIALSQPAKLHSIRLEGGAAAPKTVKLYVNRVSMAFEDCEDSAPTQTLTLTPADLGRDLPLQFVKFQNVSNLSVFVEDNQEDSEVKYEGTIIIKAGRQTWAEIED